MNQRKYLLLFLLIFFSFLINSCVYYNTFFNAKKYYREALSQKENNQGRINSSIEGTLDKSIKKCAYILKEYPENKWADDALLLLGKCYYEKEKYIQALKKFGEFEKYYKNSEFYPQAKLYLAKTHLNLYEFEKASNQFSAIFSRDEFLTIRDDAYLDFAKYYLEKDNPEKATSLLNELLNMDIDKKTEIRAHFLLAKILFEHENYQKAREEFLKLNSLNPGKSISLDGGIYIGRSYIKTQDFSKAEEYFSELEEDETRPENLSTIKIYQAICKANLRDSTAFEKLFSKLNNKNISQEIQSLANFHRGNIYLTIYKNFPKAKEHLEKVKLKSLPEYLSDEYKTKLKITNKFLKIPDYIQSQKYDKLVETYLQIAEIYCFDLNQPDSALSVYDNIKSHFADIQPRLHSLSQYEDSLQLRIDKLTSALKTTVADSILDSSIVDSTSNFAFTDSTQADSVFADSTSKDSTSTISDSLLTKMDTTLVDSVENIPDSTIILQLKSKLDSVKTKSEELNNILTDLKKTISPKFFL